MLAPTSAPGTWRAAAENGIRLVLTSNLMAAMYYHNMQPHQRLQLQRPSVEAHPSLPKFPTNPFLLVFCRLVYAISPRIGGALQCARRHQSQSSSAFQHLTQRRQHDVAWPVKPQRRRMLVVVGDGATAGELLVQASQSGMAASTLVLGSLFAMLGARGSRGGDRVSKCNCSHSHCTPWLFPLALVPPKPPEEKQQPSAVISTCAPFPVTLATGADTWYCVA